MVKNIDINKDNNNYIFNLCKYRGNVCHKFNLILEQKIIIITIIVINKLEIYHQKHKN